MKYEYKFVEVPIGRKGFKLKKGDDFNKCKEIIVEESNNGWRLKQVVIPTNEKTTLIEPYCYQIIFEKCVEE
nr:DUF4177 domain-containing protein [Tissierella sp.]